jgi:branched-chain amino acid transport system substrate-binding protein
MKALRSAAVTNDPRGVVRLDDYGNPIMNVYIRKVERSRDGKLVNAVVKTYGGVSQFWSYDPKQFLASPVYSRDYPPAKNLE